MITLTNQRRPVPGVGFVRTVIVGINGKTWALCLTLSFARKPKGWRP